jgi:isopenicillin N synthase-like dioxygenase
MGQGTRGPVLQNVGMSSLLARDIERSTLPIISLARLDADDLPARLTLAREVRAACVDMGFFYVTDHGVPAALTDAVVAQARRFFALPLEEKLRIDIRESIAYRGYEPLRTQTLESGAPADLKEGFVFDRHVPADDPAVIAKSFGIGPNHWPGELPGFRETLESYRDIMNTLARKMVRCMALSLDLAEDALDGFCEEPSAMLRLVHYPPQPVDAAPNEKGCGAHTDWGAFTFLLQDDAGGLQVWDRRSDGWVNATPIPGTFVVNVGDLMARWTNDLYRSTMHRVVNVSGRDRISVPYFYQGRLDYPVSSMPSSLAPGEAPKYPPTTPAGHLAEMVRLTYI